MSNPFCHIELNTTDLELAKKFYGSLFGWTLRDMPMGPMTYTMIDVGKGVGGGMQVKPMPDAPTQWVPYVLVDDVNVAIAKARELGANLVVPFMPLPDMGSLGIFIDPTGAAIGVWAPGKKPAPARKPAKKAAKKAAKPAKKAAKKAVKKVAKKPAKKAAKKPLKKVAKKPAKKAAKKGKK
jgi:uncharacterized protein